MHARSVVSAIGFVTTVMMATGCQVGPRPEMADVGATIIPASDRIEMTPF